MTRIFTWGSAGHPSPAELPEAGGDAGAPSPPPCNSTSPRTYNNQNDFVISQSQGGDGSWLKMTETDGGYRGSLTVGVKV